MNLQVGTKLIVRNSNGEVLLLKRAPKYVLQSGEEESWDIPGGRINPEESLHDALAREVFEETGVTLVDEPLIRATQDIFVMDKDLHVVRLTYTIQHDIDQIVLSDEHTDYIWVKPTDCVEMNIEPYLKAVLLALDA